MNDTKYYSYEEFKESVLNHIKDYLPEKYADSIVSIGNILKTNDQVLDALTIRSNNSNMSPSIYLNSYYEEFMDGSKSLDEVMKEIAKCQVQNEVSKDFDISVATDWNKVKNNVFCRLTNAEYNKKLLSDKPYTIEGDFAVTYHICVSGEVDSQASITIHDGLMKNYGISKEELHKTALENTDRLFPTVFKNMFDVMKEMMPDMPDEMFEQGEVVPMYCLTNETKMYGAAAILNTDVMDKVAEQLGGDFFIIPSSVHEVIILPKTDDMGYQELEAMICEVNATSVAPNEKLSDHAYQYDVAEKKIERCDKSDVLKSFRKNDSKDIQNREKQVRTKDNSFER